MRGQALRKTITQVTKTSSDAKQHIQDEIVFAGLHLDEVSATTDFCLEVLLLNLLMSPKLITYLYCDSIMISIFVIP